ncbi:MAG TPA: zinc-binding dehydrogenase [Jatrophihabitans sp.]|nr:zinc-binding dehydrogenase [Jatrophihabitans sp.]
MLAAISTPAGPRSVAVVEGVPDPAPGPHEAVIATEAFSLNRGELALLAARPAGWRPGQDVAGTVVRAAADGTGPQLGTRVVGLVEQAGWAERVAVPIDRLAVLPDGVESAAAATLGIAGRTALRTTALGGSLLGRTVLVTGAAGGLGRFQIQLAALAGASVTAVSRRSGTEAALHALGATTVISTADAADGLFDLVLEGVGGSSLARSIRAVSPGGTIVLIGASDPDPAPIRLTDFFGHEAAMIRTYFSYADTSSVADDLALLVRLLAEGRLRADRGIQADWSELNTVLDSFAAGRIDGKAVITIS